MKDNYNRTINYIRLSVTDRCNLRCAYCMPESGVEPISHDKILRFEEILRLCKIFARLGIKNFRVTGGEPLVRQGTVGFMRELRKIRGVENLTLTTNGILLQEHLEEITGLGIDGINLSLDTLDRWVYKALSGSDGYDKVIEAITACKGLVPVKVNCVPICGVNESELADVAGLARDTVSAVRFIELMPVGLGASFNYITAEKTKAILEEAYGKLKPCEEKLGSGPARYYMADGFLGKIGIISPLSHEFCGGCNRVRLTSDGRLRLCLAHDEELSLRDMMRGGASDDKLAKMILEAVKRKPRMHGFNRQANELSMSSIGG